jgi:hypothetical protein
MKSLGKPANTNNLHHSLAEELLFQSSVHIPKEKKIYLVLPRKLLVVNNKWDNFCIYLKMNDRSSAFTQQRDVY